MIYSFVWLKDLPYIEKQFLQYTISIITQRFEKHINIEIYQTATTQYWPSSPLIWKVKSFLSCQEQKNIFLLLKETVSCKLVVRGFILILFVTRKDYHSYLEMQLFCTIILFSRLYVDLTIWYLIWLVIIRKSVKWIRAREKSHKD